MPDPAEPFETWLLRRGSRRGRGGVCRSACLAVPIPAPEEAVLAGSRVTPAMTAPIQRGVTTRSEVIHLSGEPSVELPAPRIAAYQWEALIAYVPWVIIPFPVYAAPIGGVLDVGESYVLLIAFDANDRVVWLRKTCPASVTRVGGDSAGRSEPC